MTDHEIVKDALSRGLARAGAADWAGAAESFRRAVSFDPTGAESRYRLGWALWKRSEEDKPTMTDLAVGYGAQVLGFDSFARDRGRKFARHKNLLQDSAHWLREAIARDPKHADAHFYLAQALKALGYKQEAVLIARKASELQPDNRKYATLVATYADEPSSSFEHRASESGGKLTWNDLVLNPKTKRELRQMQLMLENPTHARELGVEPPTGILLKGAPGTGKTTIARVLANEARCKFFSITPADINQMYVGVSEQRVKELFSRARANAP
jgi:SpoVK/Ycf46/Vps4 family AAA+-type ATPase